MPNATRPLARGPANMKQVYLLSESRQMPQEHQQEDLQSWNRFTYSLRAGKCHKIISKRTYSHETGSLTGWKQANATRPSARGLAAMIQVHLLSESRQMPQDPSARGPTAIKQVHLHTESRKCHKTISKSTCSHKAGSLTYWQQANATRPSARAPAAMKLDYPQFSSVQVQALCAWTWT